MSAFAPPDHWPLFYPEIPQLLVVLQRDLSLGLTLSIASGSYNERGSRRL